MKSKLPYTIEILNKRTISGTTYLNVTTRDLYDRKRYALERKLFRGFTDVLQGYLKLRPNKQFTDQGNLARILTYAVPSVRHWAKYMPSGFATHNVHNPRHKHLADGKKVDLVLKRLFRHASDAVGLRSRAYTLSYWVHEWLKGSNVTQPRWLSIAAGSGQPVYDILAQMKPSLAQHTELTLLEIDRDMIAFAEKTFRSYSLHLGSLDFKYCDVTDQKAFSRLLAEKRPQIVDAMGLFEYLEEKEASALIRTIIQALPAGGMFVFTNMRDDHKHLTYHKRGFGWPGVIPRSAKQVLALIRDAGVDVTKVTVASPDDQVYNVYRINA